MNRRGFLAALGVGLAAPAIVRAEWLMPVRVWTPLAVINVGKVPGFTGPAMFSAWVKAPGAAMWSRVHKEIILDGTEKKVGIFPEDLKPFQVNISEPLLDIRQVDKLRMFWPQLEQSPQPYLPLVAYEQPKTNWLCK